MCPHLLAEHRVVADGADEIENRPLDGVVYFGDWRAVDLRGRTQRLRPEVRPRHGVGTVRQPMKKGDVIGADHEHSFAEAAALSDVVTIKLSPSH